MEITNVFHSKKSLIYKKKIVYQKALILAFNTSFRLQDKLDEFTTRIQKFKMLYCAENSVFNARIEYF